MIGKESPFGLQFDSLADIISFGAAPAFLMQRVILHEFERLGLVVASVYLLCGALRLARYNCLASMPNSGGNKEFLGFPIPASAALVASLTIFFIWLEGKEMTDTVWRWVLLSVLVFLSVMMVSEVIPHLQDSRLSRAAAVHEICGFCDGHRLPRGALGIHRSGSVADNLHRISRLRFYQAQAISEIKEEIEEEEFDEI